MSVEAGNVRHGTPPRNAKAGPWGWRVAVHLQFLDLPRSAAVFLPGRSALRFFAVASQKHAALLTDRGTDIEWDLDVEWARQVRLVGVVAPSDVLFYRGGVVQASLVLVKLCACIKLQRVHPPSRIPNWMSTMEFL